MQHTTYMEITGANQGLLSRNCSMIPIKIKYRLTTLSYQKVLMT
ncbi:hypothetical protein Phpb_00382 [Photorhabdus namnaonensis]|uniref:Uncharacterized protein n=1 Tax=Photorhabdus namnaonensis TaxID=1851568 RepID=A0A1B8YN24_9GAMM|nr:hypothetical protein Phpb_00382 [Photorhabdus namnaonensis]